MTAEDTKLDIEALDRALSIKTALANIMVVLSERDQYKAEAESLWRANLVLYKALMDARARLKMLDGEPSPEYVVRDEHAMAADYPTEKVTL